MKSQKSPESFKTLNEKQWNEWNRTIFSLFWKIWGIALLVQLLLFAVYVPTPEISRSFYFYLFVIKPSGLEAIILICTQLIITKLIKSRKRYIASLYTIVLITSFAGIIVCIHTSVKMLQTLLLLPMMLTPLYKEKRLTLLQAFLVILLYILCNYYFLPNAVFLPAENAFTPYVDLSIFIGASIATYVMLERVNSTITTTETLSRHDSLTHLYNHENFYEELEYYRNKFESPDNAFSIIIADIDNFKSVNDTYGHAFGDEVICKVGEIFLKNGKKDAFCARYGGEEFAMILPHTDPVTVAEQIRADFEAYAFNTPEGFKHFTLSLGAAIYNRKYSSCSSFFEVADAALYQAKRTGKNRVVLGGESNESSQKN